MSKNAAEKIGDTLHAVANRAADVMVGENYLQFREGSMGRSNYSLAAKILAHNLCSRMVLEADRDQDRAFKISLQLKKCLVDETARLSNVKIQVSKMVLSNVDFEYMALANAGFDASSAQTTVLPMSQIVDALYIARSFRLNLDMAEGANLVAQQGPWSVANYMLVAKTLILQVTNDASLAADAGLLQRMGVGIRTLTMDFGEQVLRCVR